MSQLDVGTRVVVWAETHGTHGHTPKVWATGTIVASYDGKYDIADESDETMLYNNVAADYVEAI